MDHLTAEIKKLKGQLQQERKARLQAESSYLELLTMRHENPNPILRLAPSGTLFGANAASLGIVNALLDKEEDPFLTTLLAIVQESAFARKSVKKELEYRGKHYLCCTAPAKTGKYVNVYLTDITDRKRTEYSLQESQHLVQKILSTIPHILYLYDLIEGRNIFSNEQIGDLLGYSPEEVKGMGENLLSFIIHPEDEKKVEEHFEELAKLEDGKVRENQYRAQHKNGHYIWMHSRNTCFKRTSDGRVWQVIGTAVDVTEKVLAEEQINQQKKFYEMILNHLPSEIAVLDADCRYLYLNPLTIKDEKYRHWLIGQTDHEYAIFRGKDSSIAENRQKIFGWLKETKGTQEWEEKFLLPNGQEIWMHRRLAPVLDGEGEVAYMIGFGLDITARKKNEERLRLFESMILHAKDAVLITNTQMDSPGPQVLFINPAFSATTGYEASEILGLSPRILQGPDTDRLQVKKMRESLLRQEPVEVELVNYRKDGTPFWVNISIVPVMDEQGTCTHFVSVQRDITERVKAQDEIRRSAERNRTILSSLPDTMFLINPEGLINDIKIASQDALFARKSPIRGGSIFSLLPPDLSERLSPLLHQKYAPGLMDIFDYEFNFQGKTFYYEFRLIPYHEEEFLFISRDITKKSTALRELEEQRQFIRQIIDNTPNPIFVKGADGQFLLANQAFASLYETSLDHVNEMNKLMILQNPEENKQFILDDLHVIRTKEEVNKEETFTRPSGHKAWMHTVKRPIIRADGSVQVLGVSTDITEIKRAKEELKQREELYRLLSENSRDIICLHDKEGNYLFVSNSVKEMLGYEPLELIGLSPYQYMHPDDSSRIKKSQNKSLAKGQTMRESLRFITKEGEFVWYETIIKAIKDESGKITRLQSASRNISERKKNEEKIIASEKRYRNLIHYSQAIILSHDLEGKILSVNPSLQEILGYEESDILGKNIQKYVPTSHRPNLQGYLASFRAGNHRKGITCVIDRYGKRRYLLSQAYKVEEKGTKAYIIAFAQDISDRLLAEHELRRAKKAAEVSARAKEDFLANMSHEIRTPMNGVIGMTGLLAKTVLDEKQRSLLKNIHVSAQNLLVIINDILDVAKIESGKLEIEQIPFHLGDTVMATFQSQLYKVEEKQVELHLNQVPLSDQVLLGDPYRLNQILLNLLSNAIKFTEKGEVSLSVFIIEDTKETVTLEFSVKDTGIGIPPDKHGSIFNGFTQAYASTTRQFGGTGLGLTICKNLIEKQGGRIWLQSKVNKGSDFRFQLSYLKAQQKQEIEEKQPSRLNFADLGKIRVLLAEDNEINRFLASSILKNWGFEVDTAANGQEAVDLVLKQEYDLVLMDIQMPVMNGIQATQCIRQLSQPIKASVPIIAFTANALKGEDEKYLAAGMDDYLSKPFNEEKLLQKITANLKKNNHKAKEAHFSTVSPTPSAFTCHEPVHSLFSLDQLQKMCGGDQDFLIKMLQLFLEIVPGYLQEIKNLEKENRWDDLGAVAHKLKPNIDTMGIISLKENIRNLESYGKAGSNLDEIPILVHKLELIMTEVLEQIKEELSKIQNTEKALQ